MFHYYYNKGSFIITIVKVVLLAVKMVLLFAIVLCNNIINYAVIICKDINNNVIII